MQAALVRTAPKVPPNLPVLMNPQLPSALPEREFAPRHRRGSVSLTDPRRRRQLPEGARGGVGVEVPTQSVPLAARDRKQLFSGSAPRRRDN